MKWLSIFVVFCSFVWGEADEVSPCVFPCPQHEVWEKCIENLCIAKYCTDLGYPLDCTKVPEKDCTSGCICESGYLRNRFGKCVPINDCPSCGGDPHATLGCSNYCRHSCSDYKDVNKICPIGCIQNGCKCRDGYVYQETLKRCVRPIQCPKTCGPNSIRIRCYIRNPPTCANPNPKPCPFKRGDCNRLSCKCIDGYILAKIGGTCIKKSDCPKIKSCRDPRREWTNCGSLCPPSCDNYKNTCISCPAVCIPGCFCKKQYVQDSNGNCIRPQDCPRKCGVNEYWDWCPPNCPHQNCSAIWSKFDCSKAPKCCIPQCRCRSGYFRNDKGICITIAECSPKCGKNAHCVCDEGYTKKGNVCVEDNDCEHVCGAHAHWSECINPCPKGAKCFVPCIAGCLCDKGYEEVNGVCVKKHNKCGPNEHYSLCINACPKGTQCKVKCIPGCICNDGYERKGNKCVKKIVCCKHEHYSPCINPCPKGAQCFAPCIPGCLCDKGYIRKDGKCVKQKSCGTTTKTVVQSEESKSVAEESSSNSESNSEWTKRTDEDGTVIIESSNHEHHEEEESSLNEESEKSTFTTTTVETEEQ